MINIHKIFDSFIYDYQKSIISFVSEKENRKRSGSIGSGFFISYRSKKFLLTARHVIEDIKINISMNRANIIVGFENAIPLHFKKVISFNDADIAIIPLEWVVGYQKLENITFSEVSFGAACLNPYYGMFVGYPAAKNKNSLYGDTPEKMLLSYGGVREMKVEKIPDVYYPLGFSININKSFGGLNRPRGQKQSPRPQGISGGPVIGVHCLSDGRGGIDPHSFTHSICGVAVSELKARDFQNRGLFIAESLLTIKEALDELCLEKN